MSAGAESALCDAVADHLRAEPALAPWLGDPARVYGEPPAQPTYPYVTVSRTQSRPLKADGGGFEHLLTLTCAVQYGGVPEARALTAAVRAALDDAAPPLAGSPAPRTRPPAPRANRRSGRAPRPRPRTG